MKVIFTELVVVDVMEEKGVAINFVTGYDYKKMEEIEKFYSTQVDELPTNFREMLS